MVYSSMPYTRDGSPKNDGHIKSARMTHLKCLLEYSKASMSHISYYQVLLRATRLPNLLENIGEAPDRQVTKTGKLPNF